MKEEEKEIAEIILSGRRARWILNRFCKKLNKESQQAYEVLTRDRAKVVEPVYTQR